MECGDCGAMLDTVYKLQIHQLRAHKKGKLFSCHHCSFKSPRKKDVQGLFIFILSVGALCLQCFDTVGWAAYLAEMGSTVAGFVS